MSGRTVSGRVLVPPGNAGEGILLDRASVSFGRGAKRVEALADVSFAVPTGATVGIVGESGSGKSTLIRAIAGLETLSAGTITVAAGPSRIQMVFQDPASSLDPRMTIARTIVEALPARERRGSREAVTSILERVQLNASFLDRYPHELSGGQRQRVAIARALTCSPDILLLDEVTSALDVSVQADVLNLLRRLRRETNPTTVFVSHDLPVVRYMSDLIAVMYRGKLVEFGDADEVLASPSHPYTMQLINNLPPAPLRSRCPVPGSKNP